MSDLIRPTRSALIERARGDINSRIPGADSRLRRSVLGGLAVMHGGGLDAVYGYLDHIADQILPDTADSAHLRRIASMWGIPPKPAAAAAGSATSDAGGVDGTPIAAGTVLGRGDGFDYVTSADAVVAGGVVTLALTASAPGAAGLADAGVRLTLVSPIGGVPSGFTVAVGGLANGADAETEPELLSRLLARIRNPPKGGGPGDYAAWAREVAGVTRAWEIPGWDGAGSIGVAFVFDDRVNILPLAGDVTAMQAYLDARAPVTAVVIAFAPASLYCDFTISVTPNTAAVKAAVTAELADLFRREAAPGAVILRSHYDQAIGLAAGETDHLVTSPGGPITPAAGQLPILDLITWV